MNKKIVFITGGARSGKSTFALKEASKILGNKAFIATAIWTYGDTPIQDEEMKERIEKHKKQRGNEWDTYEEPVKISDVIKNIKDKYNVIVIDCLTLWLSNLFFNNKNVEKDIESLCNTLSSLYCTVFIVSNEVGSGIVPENKLARKFRDNLGILNQSIAEIADEVYMMIAGIPLKIKGTHA